MRVLQQMGNRSVVLMLILVMALAKAHAETNWTNGAFTGNWSDANNWDAVQMTMNILDAHFKSFQKSVLPIFVRRNNHANP